MRIILLICFNITFLTFSFCQRAYLKTHSQTLTDNFKLNLDSIKVIGFGAFHGSSETENAEILLLNKIFQTNHSMNYFPETDFSTAYYFEKYLNSGDGKLLKDLINEYRIRVPQEGSIEFYDKWQNYI
ncbi:MAG: hypothetical protein HYR91_04340 [Flavobacteriia bacterium]|nr:hypothetical protein [Flavobacteriia bacterium]